ncbi:AAA family ATPase [Vibrio splendidus]|uniref:AAA family ATPase n=1 Tax=Vibrio splendidus TaxID=29497 RepID=UPI0011B5115D|nr:AAA family ATPase [Vibrio splendidus]
MELVYLWTKGYKNIKGGYHLSSKYRVDHENSEFIVRKIGGQKDTFFSSDGQLQISTIVGKNGSGKSNLLKIILEVLSNKLSNSVALIFKMEGELQVIGNLGAKFLYQEKNIKRASDKFFTIYFNYMLDTLQDDHSEFWLNDLFHRSDNYNTPVLIEPFKKHGKIDINNIEYLNQQRIVQHQEFLKKGKLCDLFTPANAKISINTEKILSIFEKDQRGDALNKVLMKFKHELNDLKELLPLKETRNIALDYSIKENPTIEKFKYKNQDVTLNELHKKPPAQLGIFKNLLTKDKRKPLEIKIKSDRPSLRYRKTNNLTSRLRIRTAIKNEILRLDTSIINMIYIANKIDRLNNENEDIDYTIDKDHRLISARIKNQTHKTYKLRTAIKFQKYITSNIEHSKIQKPIDLPVSDAMLRNAPAWLKVDFHDGKGVTFSSLSSGEKSLYTLFTTIKYHLNNIKSYNNGNNAKYSNIVLLLDEVDLGLHPTWQRDFISDTVKFLTKDFTEQFKFHVILTSHSPFIISDIPSDNVLFLEDGKESRLESHPKTFGENIHTLLSDTFFMDNGLLTGAFAQEKIECHFNAMQIFINSDIDKNNDNDNDDDDVVSNYEKIRNELIETSSIIGDDYLSIAYNNTLAESEKKHYKISKSIDTNKIDLLKLSEILENDHELYKKIIKDHD